MDKVSWLHPCLSISTATDFSFLNEFKSLKPGLSALLSNPLNLSSTQRPETSLYGINQIIWSPSYMSLCLLSSFDEIKIIFPPWPDSTYLFSFTSFSSSLYSFAPARLAPSLYFWANSFHSSRHFHWRFPLPGTLCLHSNVWVASRHSRLSSNVTSSKKPSRDTGHQQIWSDASCHTLFTQPSLFSQILGLSKIIVYTLAE